jgi:hypothetical protein
MIQRLEVTREEGAGGETGADTIINTIVDASIAYYSGK